SIDPAAATRAYLDELPPDQRARSDAYFEGGYWLHLWTFLWAAAIFGVLLHTGLSAKMRDLAVRATRIRALQTALYWTQFVIAVARANGIHTGEVWEIDASKQSKRVSANVSGLFGTERITLNDNLLNRASLPEIEAVMGHEMGHYVLNHIHKGLMEIGIVIVVGYALIAWLFERLRRRYEARWRVQDVGDLAGLPLAALLLS